MAWRTPPSLKWLIVKRSRLSGEIQKLDAECAVLKEQFERLEDRANKLRQHLCSLDHTFQLHEVQVEPTELAIIVPHWNQRIFPHGQMSRHIRRILATNEGWASTTEVTLKIIQCSKVAVEDEETYTYVHVAVRKRLRSMLKKGEVRRLEGPTRGRCYDGSNQSMWQLAEPRS